jgi:competence protein ComEA
MPSRLSFPAFIRVVGGSLPGAALLWVVAVVNQAPASAQIGELPPGEGRDTVLQFCSDCHGVDNIAAQRRSRLEWRSVVEDMAARGSSATAEDLDLIITYIVANFGRANVNRAPAADLVEIVGLSATEASAVVEFRMRNGDYRSLDDLKKVPGLAGATVEARKDRIVFTGP